MKSAFVNMECSYVQTCLVNGLEIMVSPGRSPILEQSQLEREVS